MSPAENKKCSPLKVFGIKPPSKMATFDKKGPRCPDVRLSLHYISPEMTVVLNGIFTIIDYLTPMLGLEPPTSG